MLLFTRDHSDFTVEKIADAFPDHFKKTIMGPPLPRMMVGADDGLPHAQLIPGDPEGVQDVLRNPETLPQAFKDFINEAQIPQSLLLTCENEQRTNAVIKALIEAGYVDFVMASGDVVYSQEEYAAKIESSTPGDA